MILYIIISRFILEYVTSLSIRVSKCSERIGKLLLGNV